jgi:hypothetical protein
MSEEQGPSVSSAIDDNLAIILHLAGQQAEVCTLFPLLTFRVASCTFVALKFFGS